MKRLNILLLTSTIWVCQGFAQSTSDTGVTSYALHAEDRDTPLFHTSSATGKGQIAKDGTGEQIGARSIDLPVDSILSSYPSEPIVIDALFMHPNPTSGMVRVKLPGRVSLQVYTLAGQLVSRHQLSHGEKYIDLSALPPGIYQVRAKSEEDYYSGKLLIQ